MRIWTLTVLGTVMLSSAAFADDFGPRFDEKTPPGLADYTVPEEANIAMDEAAEDLQNIIPASGEEEISEDAQDNPAE